MQILLLFDKVLLLKADLHDEYQDFNIVIAQTNGRPFEEHMITKKLKALIAEISSRSYSTLSATAVQA